MTVLMSKLFISLFVLVVLATIFITDGGDGLENILGDNSVVAPHLFSGAAAGSSIEEHVLDIDASIPSPEDTSVSIAIDNYCYVDSNRDCKGGDEVGGAWWFGWCDWMLNHPADAEAHRDGGGEFSPQETCKRCTPSFETGTCY